MSAIKTSLNNPMGLTTASLRLLLLVGLYCSSAAAFSLTRASSSSLTMSKTLLPHIARLQSECRLVLASGSPRRRELLAVMGLPAFEVMVSNFPENLNMNDFSTPQAYCLRTAEQKVEDVCRLLGRPAERERVVVIGADTIVAIDGHILEKPKDDEDARRMLRMLSGKTHEVHTAVTIFSNAFEGCAEDSVAHTDSFVETTKVKFTELTAEDIEAYVATREGADKAGSYGIQGVGGQMVEGLEGCYFNVMGFPIHKLSCRLALLMARGLKQ